jgi:DNA polymerase-3 subunit gamma/tau
VSAGLTEMRGATAPRLLLEIMLARILLPGADDTAEGLGARIDRLERRLSVPASEPASGALPARAPAATVASGDLAAPAEPVEPSGAVLAASPPDPVPADPAPVTATAEAATADDASAETGPGAAATMSDAPAEAARDRAEPAAAPAAQPAAGRLGLVDVRQLWPGVLDRVKGIRRYAWVLLSQNAQVKAVEGDLLTIGMVNAGARDSLTRSGADEILRQALIDELGVEWRIEAIVDPDATPAARTARERPQPTADEPVPPAPTGRPPVAASAPTESDAPAESVAPPAWAVGGDEGPPEQQAGDDQERPRPSRAAEAEAAKAAVRPMQAGPKRTGRGGGIDESEVSDDDSVIDDGSVSDQELLARELGAEVIEDIRHEAG